MYKIKQIYYDVNPDVKPDVTLLEGVYNSKNDAEKSALSLANKTCASLNEGGNAQGNYFETGKYEEVYLPGGVICPYYPVSVLWYDHAPDDRMNDCDIRIVVGYEIINV